jgi:hypothetical protein
MSKLKKLVKKLGKAALIGGTGYALMKGLGKKKSDGFLSSGAAGGARLPKGDRMARAIKAMTSNDAYNDDTMPGMLSKSMGRKRRDSILASPEINRMTDYYGESLKKGGRVGCGKAKRGFGRALKKGKK